MLVFQEIAAEYSMVHCTD